MKKDFLDDSRYQPSRRSTNMEGGENSQKECKLKKNHIRNESAMKNVFIE